MDYQAGAAICPKCGSGDQVQTARELFDTMNGAREQAFQRDGRLEMHRGRDDAERARDDEWVGADPDRHLGVHGRAADGGQRTLTATLHLHGGLGVDVTYPIHRYFLRAKQTELMLGGAAQSLAALGDRLATA